MKFCIILGLVVCAFVAQTNANVYKYEPLHQRLAFAAKHSVDFENALINAEDLSLEKLRELLENLVNVLLPIADEVLENATAFLEEALAKAKEFIANAEPIVKDVIDDIMRVLAVLAEEHAVAIKCVKEQRPAIEALARDSAAKLKVCRQNAVEDAKKIKGEIQAEIDAVKASLAALKDLLAECKNDDAAEVAKCVIKKAKEIRQGLRELFDAVKKVVEATAPKVSAIVKEAMECAHPVLENVKVEGKKIVDNVKACIAGKQTIEVFADNSSLDKLRELLEKLVAKVLPIVEKLVEQADVIVKKALEKAHEIMENAEPVLKKVIDETIRVLGVLAEEHKEAVQCVKEQRPAIEALVRGSAAELKKCGEQAKEAGKQAKAEIQGEIDAVKASLAGLKDMLAECKHEDPAEVAKCVVNKSKEVRAKILEIVDNAKTVIEVAAPKVAVIVDAAKACIKPVIQNAKTEGKKIVEDVKTCIANA